MTENVSSTIFEIGVSGVIYEEQKVKRIMRGDKVKEPKKKMKS